MQTNGLVNRAQLMKAVFPQRANAQAQVDLGERWDCYNHEFTLYLRG
jgi:hypothetical protein